METKNQQHNNIFVNAGKFKNIWTLSNTFLNNKCVQEKKSEGKIKLSWDEVKWNQNMPWDVAKEFLKVKLIAINAYFKEKDSNKQRNFTPQGTRKKTTKLKSRRKEITKIRPEINKIQTKNNNRNINKPKSWFLKRTKIDKTLATLN